MNSAITISLTPQARGGPFVFHHAPGDPQFNSSLRQLLHVGFKLAAKVGRRYLDLLESNADVVGRNVTENIYARHLRPLFVS